MIDVRPYAPGDQAMLAMQHWQTRHGDMAGLADRMSQRGPAWTVRDAANRVICCAGLIDVHARFAIGWAALALAKGQDMVALTRRCRHEIDAGGYARVEMLCDMDFEGAHRWALALGFELEGVRRKLTGDGRDQLAFVRIREDAHGI